MKLSKPNIAIKSKPGEDGWAKMKIKVKIKIKPDKKKVIKK